SSVSASASSVLSTRKPQRTTFTSMSEATARKYCGSSKNSTRVVPKPRNHPGTTKPIGLRGVVPQTVPLARLEPPPPIPPRAGTKTPEPPQPRTRSNDSPTKPALGNHSNDSADRNPPRPHPRRSRRRARHQPRLLRPTHRP